MWNGFCISGKHSEAERHELSYSSSSPARILATSSSSPGAGGTGVSAAAGGFRQSRESGPGAIFSPVP